MMGRVISMWRAAILMVFWASMSVAQSGAVPLSPILTIESDRLFVESDFGRRVAAEIEADQSVLLAENRKIEANLAAEEKRLTDIRKTMEPEDFRAVADAFDKRVQEIRTVQDGKARTISEKGDQERKVFIQAARPVLVELLRESGAGMILERRSILVSVDAIDITDKAILRLNQAIGDGAGLSADQ